MPASSSAGYVPANYGACNMKTAVCPWRGRGGRLCLTFNSLRDAAASLNSEDGVAPCRAGIVVAVNGSLLTSNVLWLLRMTREALTWTSSVRPPRLEMQKCIVIHGLFVLSLQHVLSRCVPTPTQWTLYPRDGGPRWADEIVARAWRAQRRILFLMIVKRFKFLACAAFCKLHTVTEARSEQGHFHIIASKDTWCHLGKL